MTYLTYELSSTQLAILMPLRKETQHNTHTQVDWKQKEIIILHNENRSSWKVEDVKISLGTALHQWEAWDIKKHWKSGYTLVAEQITMCYEFAYYQCWCPNEVHIVARNTDCTLHRVCDIVSYYILIGSQSKYENDEIWIILAKPHTQTNGSILQTFTCLQHWNIHKNMPFVVDNRSKFCLLHMVDMIKPSTHHTIEPIIEESFQIL